MGVMELMLSKTMCDDRFVRHWILGASLVLALDLVVSIDTLQPPHIILARKASIEAALPILAQHKESEEAAKVVRGVLEAAEKRLHFDGSRGEGEKGNLRDFFKGVKEKLTGENEVDSSESLPFTLVLSY